ncbi:hypothetical protein [Chachezhania antarctica]|uniref:hypothetical protein n=1 Tax=Chachezhania antarctica TaxID=2340860 RepID=UPI000EB4E856|nr:hypothetical protein [Chachezhania antarctica]|tara:strand:- start:3771 stop:4079 length:309 start_codon:yes stop_codon:yes gene_type:complete
MIRTATALALAAALATPAFAQDAAKTESCTYQAQVVAAIQQARLDRVSERDVPAHIAATNPTWPAEYSNAIPLITPWVYEQKRRVIRNQELSSAWLELCLQQ